MFVASMTTALVTAAWLTASCSKARRQPPAQSTADRPSTVASESVAVPVAAPVVAPPSETAPTVAPPSTAEKSGQSRLQQRLGREGIVLGRSQSPSRRLVALRRGDKATATLRVGRSGLWLYQRRLLAMECRLGTAACGAKRRSGERVRVMPKALGAATAEGPRLVPALAKAMRRLAGKEVLVLADRDISLTTLRQIMATARTIGAFPVLGARGAKGVVAVWPNDAPHDPKLARGHGEGEQPPSDAQGLTLELAPQTVTVVVHRKGGGYLRRAVAVDDWTHVSAWAAKLAGLPRPPPVAVVAVDGELRVGTLIQAIDALIAPCSQSDCRHPRARIKGWQLVDLVHGGAAGDVDPPAPPVIAAPVAPTMGRPSRHTGAMGGLPQRVMRGHQVDLQPGLPPRQLGRLPRGVQPEAK
ncbi:MAG: hypothetical protein KC502_02760 [Myxococcales bacterium]|nr:hypothetical protein [Myxococcales bacterium]